MPALTHHEPHEADPNPNPSRRRSRAREVFGGQLTNRMTRGRRVTSAIPVGTQFSPAVIDLPEFVRALVANSGIQSAMQAAVWSPPVTKRAPRKVPTKRRLNLPLEAAVQYGLLLRSTYEVTPLCKHLASLSGQDLYREFARHVLLECGGLRVVQAIQEMEIDGLDITGDSLSRYLTDQGFPISEHNTQINTLRMWLARAGLFPDGRRNAWKLDKLRLDELLGFTDEDIAILGDLEEDQRAFVLALCRINPAGAYRASDVRDLAEASGSIRLERSSLPKRYLEPLARTKLITYTSGGTSGGKSARLKTTQKFKHEILATFIERTVADLDAAVAAYYMMRPGDIYAALDSKDKNEKGNALEAYSILVMRLLGLRFLDWRRRARNTGFAEVDAMFSGLTGVAPTIWQVQCKNTPNGRIDTDVVAREVGLLPTTNATHILIIGNCPVTNDARRFAIHVMQRNAVTIFLLGNEDFGAVRKSPGALGSILTSQARVILNSRTDVH